MNISDKSISATKSISGRSIIGFRRGTGTTSFRAANPGTGEHLLPDFFSAEPGEIEKASSLAHDAFAIYSRASGRERGRFLRTIAAKIEAAGDVIAERAELETALPKKRLQSETVRTCDQLRLFAEVVEEGSWVMARIDRADPSRKPAPEPDLRSMLHPLGPVVVFGAVTFRSRSRWQVGTPPPLWPRKSCHSQRTPGPPRHQRNRGTVVAGERSGVRLAGRRFLAAARLRHDGWRCFGETSAGEGRGFHRIPQGRTGAHGSRCRPPRTHPGFCRDEQHESGFHIAGRAAGTKRQHRYRTASPLSPQGAGQFCTKPGIVLLPDGFEAETFIGKVKKLVQESHQFHMLTSGIRSAYQSATARRKQEEGVRLLAELSANGEELGVSALALRN